MCVYYLSNLWGGALSSLWESDWLPRQNYRWFCTLLLQQNFNYIDDVYVAGVSLTHGQLSRQHIWTFAKVSSNRCMGICPCTRPDLAYTGAVYHPSSVRTTSVKLQADSSCHWTMPLSSFPMIQFGTVRDVKVPALAASSIIHHGSASNSLSRLQTILS